MTDFSLLLGICMEFVFAIVMLLIAFYSFKIYRISYQKELKIFGTGFLFIALSYIMWVIMNISAVIGLRSSTNIGDAIHAYSLFGVGAYSHILLFLLGLATIAFVTLKNENKIPLALLAGLAIIPVLISVDKVKSFYVISIIFMLYLSLHYFGEYKNKKSKSLLFMFISFTLLAFGTLLLMLSDSRYNYYLIGHGVLLGGYLVLLANLFRSLKHGKKAK